MRPVSFQIVLGPVETTAEIDSTNAELLRRAAAGAPHGLVLVADHQTAGRGRLDRRWEDEPGAALLVSVLLRPNLPVGQAHLVTIAAGLAARDACSSVAGVTPSLKWPNDLVVDDAKLAGLLAESVLDGPSVSVLVIGMGLNIRPVSLPAGGVALESLSDRSVDRDELVRAWLDAFDSLYEPLDAVGLIAAYRSACATVGRRVRVTLGSEVIEGTATDVESEGQLVVECNGVRKVVAAGDVVHVRRV